MRRWGLIIAAYLCAGILFASCKLSLADQKLTLAVATNFQPTLEKLEAAFEEEHQIDLILVSGSTGKLYAQITQGAPYDIFLSADQWRPRKLIEDNFAVDGSAFTYAYGQLVLYAPYTENVEEGSLSENAINHLALANPDLAPYGRAAKQVIENLSLWDSLQEKVVLGQNVGQVMAFLETGNTEMGFVSLALIPTRDRKSTKVWQIPTELYDPIAQDAVLLKRAASNQTAKEFLTFLKSDAAREIIRESGYKIDELAL